MGNRKDLDFYEYYNPLKNALRNIPMLESLEVVWFYYRNISKGYDFKFPKYIESVDKIIGKYKNHLEIRRITSEWELEILAREIIINSDFSDYERYSLKQYSYFAKTFNKIKILDEQSYIIYCLRDKIFHDVYRSLHRQICWQKQYGFDMYTYLFSRSSIAPYINKIFNLDTDNFLITAFALYVQFLYKFQVSDMSIHNIPDSASNFQKVLKVISKPILDMKNILKKGNMINEKFFVYKDALVRYPILSYEKGNKVFYIAPIPELIYWRIFNGLYYDFINLSGFDNVFGNEFNNYILDITKALNTKKKLTIFPEVEYSIGKRTIDLQIVDESANLFIECKIKRLTQKAKEEILSDEAINDEIDKIIDAVVQGYKTILDYKNGYYPTDRNNNKKIYLIIVTLEDWCISFTKPIIDIDLILRNKLQEKNILIEQISDIPYFICSTEEYTKIIHLSLNYSFFDILNKKIENKEESNWRMEDFLNKNFGDFFKINPIQNFKYFDEIMSKFNK